MLRWLPVPDARRLPRRRPGGTPRCWTPSPPTRLPRGSWPWSATGRPAAATPGLGDDDERPLDARGQAQAARLADLLPLLGVDRLLSAPPLRCRDTLAPTAERLGLPVEVEPLLADRCWAQEPAEALALLRRLPAGTVACGQGEGLAGLVAALGGPVDPLPKGAARVVSRDGDLLVAADLLDPEERAPR